MQKKVALGVAGGVAALSLALGIGLYAADDAPGKSSAPTAESRPVKDGEVPAPPPPQQLKPSERVIAPIRK